MPKTACQNLARITFGDCLKLAYLPSRTSIFISPDMSSPDISPLSHRPIGIKFGIFVLLINTHGNFLSVSQNSNFFQPKKLASLKQLWTSKKNLLLPRFGFSRFFTHFPSSDWNKIWYTCASHQCPWTFSLGFLKFQFFFRKTCISETTLDFTIFHSLHI